MADDNKDNKKKEYLMKIAEATENGVFSNAVSVNMTGNECTIDFGYTLPNTEKPTIKITSRVHMTHPTAESLLKVLSNAILDFKNKKEQKQ
ncbi:DUF3467 domain-containing protein [Candidatus Peregrinibacteria bacterium]|jgi:hypothetical protein|nr:DUF3467 domain-containing protein [Candidatus Peregrinibacteria bacterium]MBT4055939.1 DUF3467 domain-containing protein [Candidatus Peregrinibacteria bacterium]